MRGPRYIARLVRHPSANIYGVLDRHTRKISYTNGIKLPNVWLPPCNYDRTLMAKQNPSLSILELLYLAERKYL